MGWNDLQNIWKENKTNYLQIFETCLKVFCLTSRRSLTDYLKKTSGSVSFDIQSPRFNKHARYPSTVTACVQKRMAESRVISRLSEVIYQTDEGAFSLISGQNEKWNTNHQWECFIQYPAASSGNIQTRVGVFQLISRHNWSFSKESRPIFPVDSDVSEYWLKHVILAGAFLYSSSNNQLYSSFREIHSWKFETCYDDQHSISLFLLHVLLTSFRDAT